MDEDAIYRCPGESAAITREVHLARLESGYSGCGDCVWNDCRPADQTANSTQQKLDNSIRRTSTGVRGPYLNAMDRFRAAQVAAILASHISRVSFVRSAVGAAAIEGVTAATVTARICVGYDGRAGSQDLFAGVVSAVLQNGCDVIDAGRCSTASLLSTCRSESNIAGCLMITGAGAKAGDVGIDVFGSDGRSLSVPWTDFGVGVRMQAPVDAPWNSADQLSAVDRWQVSDSVNRIATSLPDSSVVPVPTDLGAILELPSLSHSTQLFRTGRSSGKLSSIELEDSYRSWLLRWWPDTMIESVCFYTYDSFVRKRIRSVSADSEAIQFRTGTFSPSDANRMFTFVISEDDRHLQAYSKSGRQIPADDLATWINRSSRTTSSHVTAHPADDQQTVLLVDVASPDSGRTHEIICDALAVAGLVLTLASNPKNQFPA